MARAIELIPASDPNQSPDRCVNNLVSSTCSVRTAMFSTTRLQALRNQIQGRVLVGGDDGYDAARQTWNRTTFEQRYT